MSDVALKLRHCPIFLNNSYYVAPRDECTINHSFIFLAWYRQKRNNLCSTAATLCWNIEMRWRAARVSKTAPCYKSFNLISNYISATYHCITKIAFAIKSGKSDKSSWWHKLIESLVTCSFFNCFDIQLYHG